MPALLADRLDAARKRHFVGRAAELALFRDALTAADIDVCVLYLYGPGGIGKTTLLRQFASLCTQTGVRATYVDGRDIEPTPDAFVQTLCRALGLDAAASFVTGLGPERHVLLIDTYERLVPLDTWIRDAFLPQLPDQVLIVVAGRQPPAMGWRADPGWQALIRPLALRNLDPADSRSYLQRRNLPAAQHPTILAFTHGHPLALSLVADVFAQRRDVQFQPLITPDVINTLLEQFVQKVPSAAHRAALEACALVRLTTEGLLAELLGTSDVHELFGWLRTLSFIEAGAAGLFPHDLAREALTADLRWRNPDWYAELHRRARAYYARCLHQTQGHEQQRVMFDYVFLHRDNPLVRPFLEWQESGAGTPTRMVAADVPALLAMVTEHEGPESAQLAAWWLARQPQGVTVYRDAEQQPKGFVQALELQAASDEDRAPDPAARAAWRCVRERAPLRAGERATLFRFWMAHDTYQSVSATQSLIFVNIALYYLNTPALAYTLLPCAEPDFWEPAFAYMDLARLDAAEFTVGTRRYGVFGHDWRSVPPLAWLDLLGERELATEPLERRPATSPALVVLSQTEFAAAVRAALHQVTRPTVLQTNPLIRSRLVLERAGPQAAEPARVAELQRCIRRAAEELQTTPRDTKYYRAVYHTFLQPAPTQERAAELLDVPFSSYRRHLQAGIAAIAETLWQWELHGAEATPSPAEPPPA